MPRKTLGRERFALLVGVEITPQPGARLGPRSVPPHAWTEQIIWDYVGPTIPELTTLVVLNPVEFLVFRGSRSAGEGFNLEEAAATSAGLHDTETIWVGKPVPMRCMPRLLKDAAKDIEASREYVRCFNLECITTSLKKEAETRAQRLQDMPPPPSPRGRGLVRRADRYATQQYYAHQHSPECEQLLQDASMGSLDVPRHLHQGAGTGQGQGNLVLAPGSTMHLQDTDRTRMTSSCPQRRTRNLKPLLPRTKTFPPMKGARRLAMRLMLLADLRLGKAIEGAIGEDVTRCATHDVHVIRPVTTGTLGSWTSLFSKICRPITPFPIQIGETRCRGTFVRRIPSNRFVNPFSLPWKGPPRKWSRMTMTIRCGEY